MAFGIRKFQIRVQQREETKSGKPRRVTLVGVGRLKKDATVTPKEAVENAVTTGTGTVSVKKTGQKPTRGIKKGRK